MGYFNEEPTNVNHELQDLKTGYPLLPPNANAARTLEIVPIHDHVDQQVDVNNHPLHGRRTDQLRVAEQSSGSMVVRVKECQGLLLEEQKDGIDQLDIFGQVVELDGTRQPRLRSERASSKHLHSTAE